MQSEEKKMKGKDPCWKGYEMVGTKKKNGKEVPNCVPKEEVELEESFEVKYAMNKKGPIKVTKFNSLDDAKEFLQTVRAAGMNGIISKGGKPIKEESKAPAGMKFISSYVYKGGDGKDHKHTHYRKGTKMSDPVVVHIDGQEWKTFASFTKAKQSAIDYIKGMKPPSKFAKEQVELDESQAFNRKELEAGNITIVKDKNGYRYLKNKSKNAAMGPYHNDAQVKAQIMKIQKEEVELDEGMYRGQRKTVMKPANKSKDTIQISFRSSGEKTKWMKKQSIAQKEIIDQSPTFVELPSSFKKYAKKEDHPEIYQVKESVEQVGEAIKRPSKPAFKKQSIDDLPSWREREGKPAYEPAPKNKRYAKSPRIKHDDPPTAGERARMKKEEVEQIDEKSVSQNQQKLMGMALAYKRGELDNASDEVKKLASSMSEKDLRDFAKTKHKGLPVKKEETQMNKKNEEVEYIDEATNATVTIDGNDLPYYGEDPAMVRKHQSKYRIKIKDKGKDIIVSGPKKGIIGFLKDKDAAEMDMDDIKYEFPELFESKPMMKFGQFLESYKKMKKEELSDAQKKHMDVDDDNDIDAEDLKKLRAKKKDK